jgi:hypothetical protein
VADLRQMGFWTSLIAASGGGAVAAVASLKFFGGRWFDHQLQKRLEEFKHGQEIKLEQFRSEMDSDFSRISKIHEKEMEVLSRAWELLQEAHGAVSQVTSALKKSFDFVQVPELEFEEFLKVCPLSESQKSVLRTKAPKDRTKQYDEAIFWLELGQAKTAQTALNNYLALKSIFLTETLQERFGDINNALQTVLIQEEVSHGLVGYNYQLNTDISENMNRISAMFDRIKPEVQKRLGYEKA